jgi:SAM-dependent methyltransferase
MKLPINSVRGRIRAFIESHADKLGNDVLEIGSRMTNPHTWWIVNRDLAEGQWTGCDMQSGDGVDVVADIHNPPSDWQGRFTGILCSEVMEHIARPHIALPKIRELLKPDGFIIITTLFAFPEHGFPDDYFRYSRSGLKLLLEDAGFVDIETEYAGEVVLKLNDHGEANDCTRVLPMHTFAIARTPC